MFEEMTTRDHQLIAAQADLVFVWNRVARPGPLYMLPEDRARATCWDVHVSDGEHYKVYPYACVLIEGEDSLSPHNIAIAEDLLGRAFKLYREGLRRN